MKRWHWFVLGVVFVAAALGLFFRDFTTWKKSARPALEREIPVLLVQARRVSHSRRIKVIGELRPGNIFNIRSRLAGKVGDVCCKVGDVVKAGALLAAVRDDGLERRIAEQGAAIHAAREEIRTRQAHMTQTEKRVTDLRELVRRELIPRRDFEMAESVAATSRAQLELAQASLAQREAVLAQLRAMRKLTNLLAPADGLISRIFVGPGASVREDAAIMTVMDISELKLADQVPADTAKTLRNGMVGRVSSGSVPGVVAEGKVIRVEPNFGGDGDVVVEVEFANPQRVFRPGMAAEVSIDLDVREDRLVVPRSAVALENEGAAVFSVERGLVVRRKIDVGRELGEEIEVLHGLADGDPVIIDSKSVSPGSRVRVLPGESSDEKKRF